MLGEQIITCILLGVVIYALHGDKFIFYANTF